MTFALWLRRLAETANDSTALLALAELYDDSDQDDDDDDDDEPATYVCGACDGCGVDHWRPWRSCPVCHGACYVTREGTPA